MRRTAVVLVALALLMVGFVPGAGARRRSGVRCGDVITRDTVLRSDLACSGDGLVIGADGVTLDLNGHTVDGTLADGSVGIRNEGHHRVTIKTGAVGQFQSGVVLEDGNENRVQGLLMAETGGSGIRLSNAHRNRIERNEVTGSTDFGIFLIEAGGNVIRKNELRDNGSGGVGLFEEESVRNVIKGNRVIANGFGPCCANHGIFISSGAVNRVVGNTVLRNAQIGIFNAAAPGTLVQGNVANENGGDGIQVDVSDSTIRANTANDNGELGIEAVGGVNDGGGNRASGNGDPRQGVNVRCRPAR